MDRGQKIITGCVVALVAAFVVAALLVGLQTVVQAAGLVATLFVIVLVVLIVLIVLAGLVGKNVPEWLERRGRKGSKAE